MAAEVNTCILSFHNQIIIHSTKMYILSSQSIVFNTYQQEIFA